MIEMGNTKVICTASIQEKVPEYKRGKNSGWVTAEYSMLPGSTTERAPRDRARGRTQEIQRLIGRVLRTVVDLDMLGERTIMIDADVIQADGGTRTASITGAFVALHDAVEKLIRKKKIKTNPIKEYVAAVSVGVVHGHTLVDLPYDEDSKAEVDMNVIMTESGRLVEIQGTAETEPFSKKALIEMVDMAEKAISKLITLQKNCLRGK